MKKTLLFFFITALCYGCSKSPTPKPVSLSIVGNWKEWENLAESTAPGYSYYFSIYTNGFTQTYQFNADGSVYKKESQIAVPANAYTEYIGTYSILNNDSLQITKTTDYGIWAITYNDVQDTAPIVGMTGLTPTVETWAINVSKEYSYRLDTINNVAITVKDSSYALYTVRSGTYVLNGISYPTTFKENYQKP